MQKKKWKKNTSKERNQRQNSLKMVKMERGSNGRKVKEKHYTKSVFNRHALKDNENRKDNSKLMQECEFKNGKRSWSLTKKNNWWHIQKLQKEKTKRNGTTFS